MVHSLSELLRNGICVTKKCYYNCQSKHTEKDTNLSIKTGLHFQVFQIRYSGTGVTRIASHTGEAGLCTLYNYTKFCHSDLANIKYLPQQKTDS